MTITVHEILTGDFTAQVTGEREYTRYYEIHVPTEDQPVTEIDLASVTGVPKKYDPIGPQDPGVKCTELKFAKGGSEFVWKLTARYTTLYGNKAVKAEPNPLLRPAIWSYETVRTTRLLAKDRKGTAFYTPVVKEPFTKLPEVPHAAAKWTVQRNVLTWNDSMATAYAYTVNKNVWKTKAKWTVLCEGISAQEQWENDFHYWTMTFNFNVDERDPWLPTDMESKGHKYLDDDGNEHTSATLVYIDSNGKKSDTPQFIQRYLYDEANFNAFPL